MWKKHQRRLQIPKKEAKVEREVGGGQVKWVGNERGGLSPYRGRFPRQCSC